MTVWVLWVYLVTGERIEAGQYQTEDWCYAAAHRQKQFLMRERPRPLRMTCEPMVI
jgi:hypothetical protein